MASVQRSRSDIWPSVSKGLELSSRLLRSSIWGYRGQGRWISNFEASTRQSHLQSITKKNVGEDRFCLIACQRLHVDMCVLAHAMSRKTRYVQDRRKTKVLFMYGIIFLTDGRTIGETERLRSGIPPIYVATPFNRLGVSILPLKKGLERLERILESSCPVTLSRPMWEIVSGLPEAAPERVGDMRDCVHWLNIGITDGSGECVGRGLSCCRPD